MSRSRKKRAETEVLVGQAIHIELETDAPVSSSIPKE